LQRKARLCATKNKIIDQINFSFNKSKDDLSITLKNFKKLCAEWMNFLYLVRLTYSL
jgi:hypothetical protein